MNTQPWSESTQGMGTIETFRIAAFCSLFCLFLGDKTNAAQFEVTANTRLPRAFRADNNVIAPKWRYLLHLPSDYSSDSGKRWPTIVYLHGRSIRGKDLRMVKRYGPPAFLDKKEDFPFIVISPQLPTHSWPAESVGDLIDEISGKYRVDLNRIYLTGVSMGGGGVWNVAAENPLRYAAAAPLCGYGEQEIASKLTQIPIWAFHGEGDKVVPIGPHERLVAAVNSAGGDAKFTVIPGGTHGNIIYPTYQRKDLYDWFLSHSRQPVVAEPIDPVVIATPTTPPPPRATPVKPEQQQGQVKKPGFGWDIGKFLPKREQHVVVRGDTLWRISRNYGVTVDAIRKTNSLNGDRIDIGQVIVIPSS